MSTSKVIGEKACVFACSNFSNLELEHVNQFQELSALRSRLEVVADRMGFVELVADQMGFVGQVVVEQGADRMCFAERVVVEQVAVRIVAIEQAAVRIVAIEQAVGIEHPSFGSAEEAFHRGRPLQLQVP